MASGPPPPTLPDTISRDDQGRATVRAVRVTAPMRVDGKLDEAIYTTVLPATGFTHTVSANARLRWEYRPGSELLVVYNEERDSDAALGVPGLFNRASW